jgi:hypothetical protein
MKAAETWKLKETEEAMPCPTCGAKPILQKDPKRWAFEFGCPEKHAVRKGEMAGMTRDPSPEEIGYNFEDTLKKLITWWEGLERKPA